MKRSRKQRNVDRFSSLPDSILSHILSFLPTKSSAATSILARRWRYLWADVPTIDLDFQSDVNWKEQRPRKSDIINRIVLGHNLKALNTFRLSHTNMNEKDFLTQHELETWIAAVIARGKVRNFQLEFSDLIKVPDYLFTYKPLVKLRLYKCEIGISLPASICFPCMEKLHLGDVKYNDNESFQHLISGCPILKELMVSQCSGTGYRISGRISSPTIKWLTFHAVDHPVEIITPALRYLQLLNYSIKNILAKDLSSLTEADIKLRSFRDVEDGVVFSRSVMELLHKMSNVKCLKLDINCNKFLLSAFSYSSSRFHNLTKLELTADWRFIFKFLEIADNLQVLIIYPVTKDFECLEEPQQVCTCLLSHLTSIEIGSLCCEACEYPMIRYLLKNAKLLTTMEIWSHFKSDKERFVALQTISQFERGSDTCKVDFY